MSDSTQGEIAELADKAKELQRSLDTVSRRLDQIRSSNGETVVIPRPVPWWKQPLMVGVLSSGATAAVLTAFAALAGAYSGSEGCPSSRPVAAPAAPPATAPLAATPPAAPCTDPLPAPQPETPASPPPPVRPHHAAAPPPLPLPPSTSTTSPNGMLTIVCLPVKCSEIIDNGVPLGPGHIFSRPVPPGRHNLVLKAPNGVTKSITVEVLPDQLKDVRMAMESGGPADRF